MSVTRHTKIPWGKKLKGQTLADLDEGALKWMADNANDDDWRVGAEEELQRRKEGIAKFEAAKDKRIVPLPSGPAGLSGKHYLDTLLVAHLYSVEKMLAMGYSLSPEVVEAAQKLAVSAVIACEKRGIDLLQEIRTAGAMPDKLNAPLPDEPPF